MTEVLVLLGSFFVLCMIGMPVAYALGLAALIGSMWIDVPLEAVMIQISSGVNSFSLLAIPFFVLAGAIMAEGGMAVRLVNLARVFVGAVRGGLALVNVIASTFFSGVSGSSVADTASIGSVLIPQMVKQGYPKVFATNVTICGSVQAVLIPPSHNAVLYSLAAGGTISVAQLFMAGVLPGLLFGACVMGLCLLLSYRRGYPKSSPSRCARPDGSRSKRSGGWSLSSSSSAASCRAFSPRPSRPRWPASTPFSSRCSSTATTAGANCQCCCTA